jgi:hypothetical protein
VQLLSPSFLQGSIGSIAAEIVHKGIVMDVCIALDTAVEIDASIHDKCCSERKLVAMC